MVEIPIKIERTHPVAESTEISIEEAESVKVADRIMAEYYEIEAKVDEIGDYELALFLHNTLKRVISDLERDSVMRVG